MDTRQQFCTFHVASMLFGIRVQSVQEIIRYQEITPVPLAPKVVHGLINLRGQIVTAIDLRQLLDLPPASPDHPPMNVIVRGQDGAFSLLVDRIGDVLELELSRAEPAPGNLKGVASEVIEYAYKLDKGLLLSLDVPCLVDKVSRVVGAAA